MQEANENLHTLVEFPLSTVKTAEAYERFNTNADPGNFFSPPELTFESKHDEATLPHIRKVEINYETLVTCLPHMNMNQDAVNVVLGYLFRRNDVGKDFLV